MLQWFHFDVSLLHGKLSVVGLSGPGTILEKEIIL